MSCAFTVFSGGFIGGYDEEEEAQQQSHGGVGDVVRVTTQDKNRRSGHLSFNPRNEYLIVSVSGHSNFTILYNNHRIVFVQCLWRKDR